ncbi:hypothetical protein ACF08O_25900 [Streptomyces paradoxus]|uniref:hypothetical protein n=1 Tax=Streptomyces paradoxus TaxID=66375 RepID=UPI0037001206
MVGITNLLDAAITSGPVPVWAREPGNWPTSIGLMVSVMGAAAVGGSVIASVVTHRLRRRVMVLGGILLAGAPRFLIPAFDARWAGGATSHAFTTRTDLSSTDVPFTPTAVVAR